MSAISPADGPVAVTGASGYIGSWIVRDLMQQGYLVRGCVRDRNSVEKVEHLVAMNDLGLRGNVELFEGDLFEPGSYDAAFRGCSGVIHAGAAVGFNKETPRQVYDGCFTEVRHVVESAKAAGSVKRFVFTSSFAAVAHPRPEGYVFTEKDWCGDNLEGYRGAWVEENIDKDRDIAYAMAKASAERMIYRMAEEDGGFQAMAILPVHVLGPLMTVNHDQPWSWQNCVRQMLRGKPFKAKKGGRMLWNIVDVRDVARAHRLCAESTVAGNGSRYVLSASDRSGELFTRDLQTRLQGMFVSIAEVGGEEMAGAAPVKRTYDSPRAYCLLAKQELGLATCSVDETIRATGDSLNRLGLLST
jgi:nucleoside-diphosphate-sugar epimerase